MSFRSVAAKKMVPRMVGLMIVSTLITISLTNQSLVRAQSPQIAARPNLRLPDEAAGLDGIAGALIAAFD